MRRAFKFRIYPNRNQLRELEIALETHRRLYNDCLDERKARYEAEKVTVKYAAQSARFKAERATNPFYARLNFSSAQATMRRLDKGFVAFFRRVKAGEKPGYPRFRGRDRYDSIEYPASRRRHPPHRRSAPRPARRGDPGQAAPRSPGRGEDRHPEARGRQVVRRPVVRPRGRGGRAEHQTAGRHRRGPQVVPVEVGRVEGRAESPLPQDRPARVEAQGSGRRPQAEGRQEPQQGGQEAGQGACPGRGTCGPSITTRSR